MSIAPTDYSVILLLEPTNTAIILDANKSMPFLKHSAPHKRTLFVNSLKDKCARLITELTQDGPE
jgi:hypothetical protein